MESARDDTTDNPNVRPSEEAADLNDSSVPPEKFDKFQTLINSIDGIFWEADAETFAFTYVSKQAERILGYPVERWINEPGFWVDRVHPEDRDWAVGYCISATQRKEDHHFEYRMEAGDGRIVWIRDIVTVHVEDDRPKSLSGLMVDITESKLAQETILKEKLFKEELLESLPGMFYVYTDQGERLLWNKQFEQTTGYTADELHAISLLDPIAEEHRKMIMERVGEVFEKGLATAEADIVAKDGTRIPHFFTGRQVTLEGKSCIVGMGIDVTDRKRAEDQINLLQLITIEVAEAKDLTTALEVVLRRVCENTGWAIGQAWIPNADRQTLECSPAWYSSESSLDDFRDATQGMVFPPGTGLPGRVWSLRKPEWIRDVTLDPDTSRSAVAFAAGLRAGLGVPIIAGGDVVAILEFFFHERLDRDERLVGVISTVAAHIGLVIDRKRTDGELRRVSERLHLATKAAKIGIWDWDVVNDELVWDDAMYGLYGILRDDFSGAYEAWAGSLLPEDYERATGGIQAALRGEREFDEEFRIVWPDGRIHFIQAASQTFRDESGEPVRMVGVNYDITEQKLAEENLRLSGERLQLLLDSTAEGIFGVDLEGRCTFCNAAGIRLLGYEDASELWGREMHDLIAHTRADGSPYPIEQCPASDALMKATSSHSSEDIFWRKNGTSFATEYWSYPVFRDGKPIGAVLTFLDITDKKRAAEALADAGTELNEAQRLAGIGSWMWDIETNVVTWSESLYRMRDVDPSRPPPSFEQLSEFYTPESWKLLDAAVRNARETGHAYKLELEVVRHGGSTSWVIARGEAIRDENGTITKLRGTSQDINDRKRAEEALRLSEERFAKAFHASPEPISIFRNRDNKLLEANEGWAKVYGFSREEAIGSTSLQFSAVNPQDRKRLAEMLETGQTVREFEIDLRTKSGEIRHISLSAEKIVINNEVCTIYLHRDITDQKLAEAENQKLIYDMGERVKELTALHSTARVLQKDSKSIAHLLEEIVVLLPQAWQYPDITAGRIRFGDLEFSTPNYSPTRWFQRADLTAAGIAGEIEVVYLEERPPEAIGPFSLEEKSLIESLAEMINSTLKRRYSAEELRESQRRFSDTFSNLEMIAVMTDIDGRITFCNDYLLRLTGWERSEAIGGNWFDMFIPEHQQDRVGSILEAIPDDGSVVSHFENEIKTRCGEIRVVKWTNTTLRGLDGRFMGVAAFGDDITESKRAEIQIKTTTEQLRALTVRLRHAREEEGTRIAREIHDELGSALTSLKWDLELMDKSFAGPGDEAELAALREKVADMTGLIDATVDVVRRISSELRPSLLDDLGLSAAIEWQAHQFQARTGIECVCHSSVENLDLGRDRSTAVFRIFQEALTNILRHAHATRVECNLERNNGAFTLSVTDNGRGISEREISESRSLGLLGMRERAGLIGGHIDIFGSPGKGTEVKVEVPYAQEMPAE